MARKVRRQSPAASPPKAVWPALLAVCILSAALGSGLTYLALRPQLARSAAAQHLTADASLSLANAAFDSKNWPDAVKYYAQAIAAGDDTPDIRTDYGTALRGLNQPQKALEQYQAAQKADPNHENSLLNQGIVYASNLHDPVRAASVWQTYLARFPHGAHTADVKRLLTGLPPAAASKSTTNPPKS